LIATITSSTTRRQPVELDGRKPIALNGTHNGSSQYLAMAHSAKHDLSLRPRLTEAARDPRDEAAPTPPTASRPASPYTLNPPIDFDGLSWPSKLTHLMEKKIVILAYK